MTIDNRTHMHDRNATARRRPAAGDFTGQGVAILPRRTMRTSVAS